MILHVYLDDETVLRLRMLAREMDRTIASLVESAAAEAALAAFRHRQDDPARRQEGH
ncbi:hypothetical protein [Rhizobium straminoryzae]|uniref:hypothetical protein n=1 Tax=Rhizobium straminoryzae TaxID=1387186 RepID=UPI00163D9392|nr:hypothetical protein [Rhizobium straminoryzae]